MSFGGDLKVWRDDQLLQLSLALDLDDDRRAAAELLKALLPGIVALLEAVEVDHFSADPFEHVVLLQADLLEQAPLLDVVDLQSAVFVDGTRREVEFGHAVVEVPEATLEILIDRVDDRLRRALLQLARLDLATFGLVDSLALPFDRLLRLRRELQVVEAVHLAGVHRDERGGARESGERDPGPAGEEDEKREAPNSFLESTEHPSVPFRERVRRRRPPGALIPVIVSAPALDSSEEFSVPVSNRWGVGPCEISGEGWEARERFSRGAENAGLKLAQASSICRSPLFRIRRSPPCSSSRRRRSRSRICSRRVSRGLRGISSGSDSPRSASSASFESAISSVQRTCARRKIFQRQYVRSAVSVESSRIRKQSRRSSSSFASSW